MSKRFRYWPFAASLFLIVALVFAGCEPAEPGEGISAELDYTYRSQLMGASLVADIRLSNESRSDYTLNAFVFAAREGPPPTPRGVFPAGALRDIGVRDTFHVTDPELGHSISLPAGEEIEFSADIIVPGAGQGQDRLAGQRFDYLRLHLVNDHGEEVYTRQWMLNGAEMHDLPGG